MATDKTVTLETPHITVRGTDIEMSNLTQAARPLKIVAVNNMVSYHNLCL
jgi:hypothetical protein